ncbi:MAG: hypothetical protein P8L66_12030 [Rhodospirillaceae bacterium]|nr:hypothetical protein [Rhodospirillaceae bacterium]
MKCDQVNRVATSLSYTLTLAFVPASPLMLPILAAFRAFAGLRDSVLDLVLTNFIPDTGMFMNKAPKSFILLQAALRPLAFGVNSYLGTSSAEDRVAFNRNFRVARPVFCSAW